MPILPGSWADWMVELSSHQPLHKSSAIIEAASRLSQAASVSLESAIAQLLWLGSSALQRHVRVTHRHGLWEPTGIAITSIEDDGAPIESVTNGILDVARRAGIDPIQDTVKEGPAGLVSRLEASNLGWAQRRLNTKLQSRLSSAGLDASQMTSDEDIGSLDTSDLQGVAVENAGNVRSLAYPSGRAFLSYLYDGAFFNVLDELLQHGNLHVRGRNESHMLRHVNLCLYAGFYQGALVNLLGDFRVQNNVTVLLRQLVVLWPTSGIRRKGRAGSLSGALHEIEDKLVDGIEMLMDYGSAKVPEIILPLSIETASKSYIDAGVGVRYSNLNREVRTTRIALGVAFWRIAAGDPQVELLDSDIAVADAIMHGHDMTSRLLEVAASRGKFGHESMRLFVALLDGEGIKADSLSFATDADKGLSTLDQLYALSILEDSVNAKLLADLRLVSAPTQRAHLKRWGLSGEETEPLPANTKVAMGGVA